MSNKRECCELCFGCMSLYYLLKVEIDGETHYICDDCARAVRKADYAEEEEDEDE